MNHTIHSPDFINEHRIGERDFTRKRCLTFPLLIHFFLNFIKSSLQTELNAFFQQRLNKKTGVYKVTAAAFSLARKKLSETAFIALNRQVIQQFYAENTVQTWQGLRVLAVDGSKYLLPNTAKIFRFFNGMTNQYEKKIPMALGSCLYDVFLNIVVEARLSAYRSSERDLAEQHLVATAKKDVILYDRGYPAFWFMAAHRDQNRFFCMRVKVGYSTAVKTFVQSGKKQNQIVLKATSQMRARCKKKGVSSVDLTVRLIRIKTRKKDYILITNLLNKRHFPLNTFKTLYHLRWQVEEGYKKQKSGLEIENFTGKSVLAIKQDFHAKILSLTLTAITAYAASHSIKTPITKRNASYKINFIHVLSAMKNTVIHLLLGKLSRNELHYWLKSIANIVTIIRPNRHFTRKKKVTDRHKYPMSYKRSF